MGNETFKLYKGCKIISIIKYGPNYLCTVFRLLNSYNRFVWGTDDIFIYSLYFTYSQLLTTETRSDFWINLSEQDSTDYLKRCTNQMENFYALFGVFEGEKNVWSWTKLGCTVGQISGYRICTVSDLKQCLEVTENKCRFCCLWLNQL